jgi:hypothetical protein
MNRKIRKKKTKTKTKTPKKKTKKSFWKTSEGTKKKKRPEIDQKWFIYTI